MLIHICSRVFIYNNNNYALHLWGYSWDKNKSFKKHILREDDLYVYNYNIPNINKLQPEDCSNDEVLILPLYEEDIGYCKEIEHYDV